MEKKGKLLPQEILKLIACITMLIDHFGAAIVPRLAMANVDTVYYICRSIGRLSFPIYCFLLAEGMRHTRNPGKYLLRLGFGILLAELPYDLMRYGEVNWASQSAMVTLTLGAAMLLCMQKNQKSWLKVILIKSNYGAGGIVMIAVFGLFDQPLLQTVGIFLVNWQLLPSAAVIVFGVVVIIQLLATLAMIPIGLYSGKKLTRNRVVQWGFYLFYPVHMLILWLMLQFGF